MKSEIAFLCVFVVDHLNIFFIILALIRRLFFGVELVWTLRGLQVWVEDIESLIYRHPRFVDLSENIKKTQKAFEVNIV